MTAPVGLPIWAVGVWADTVWEDDTWPSTVDGGGGSGNVDIEPPVPLVISPLNVTSFPLVLNEADRPQWVQMINTYLDSLKLRVTTYGVLVGHPVEGDVEIEPLQDAAVAPVVVRDWPIVLTEPDMGHWGLIVNAYLDLLKIKCTSYGVQVTPTPLYGEGLYGEGLYG